MRVKANALWKRKSEACFQGDLRLRDFSHMSTCGANAEPITLEWTAFLIRANRRQCQMALLIS